MILQDSKLPRNAALASNSDLRRSFLVSDAFQTGRVTLRWWETDRTVLAAVVPLRDPINLPNPADLKSSFFLERREAGIINLGGPGRVTADGATFAMEPCDALYVGRGVKEVAFLSTDSAVPARFWLMSYPAHCAHPTCHVPFATAKGLSLGSQENANRRTLFKLIYPDAMPTCQIVMGFTRLESGSVWNSMPPHTHLRRSEVYLYFNVPEGQAVFHFMGEPNETRHLVVRDLEAVLSPPWSIHCGAGTASYSFVWCMGGENQEFSDMDPAPVAELL